MASASSDAATNATSPARPRRRAPELGPPAVAETIIASVGALLAIGLGLTEFRDEPLRPRAPPRDRGRPVRHGRRRVGADGGLVRLGHNRRGRVSPWPRQNTLRTRSSRSEWLVAMHQAVPDGMQAQNVVAIPTQISCRKRISIARMLEF